MPFESTQVPTPGYPKAWGTQFTHGVRVVDTVMVVVEVPVMVVLVLVSVIEEKVVWVSVAVDVRVHIARPH